VTRRYTGNLDPALDIGPVSIDLALKAVTVGGEDAALIAREWAVLERTVRQQNDLFRTSKWLTKSEKVEDPVLFAPTLRVCNTPILPESGSLFVNRT